MIKLVIVLAYNSYNVYLNNIGNAISATPALYFRNGLKDLISDRFDYASDVYTIQKYNRSTLEWDNIVVRLTVPYETKQTSTIKDDYREVLFKNLDLAIYMGDLFSFNNYYWMCIDTGRIETITNNCMIQRCNVELKFTASTPINQNIISIWGIATNKLYDLKTNQFILLPDGTMKIRIPNTDDSKKIKLSPFSTRFLIGNPIQKWRVEGIDSVSFVRKTIDNDDTNGIIELNVKLDQIDTNRDDLVNNVAYWFQK
jgi:hypothetical protein